MRISTAKLSGSWILALAFLSLGCDSKGDGAQASPSAAAAAPSASVAAAVSASPTRAPLPAYAGHFEGKYDAKLFRIEMTAAEGAVKQWAEDDGKAFSGSGSIAVDIAEDRRITGTSTGPLGTLRGSGLIDEGRVRVTFLPEEATAPEQAVSATLVGTLEGNLVKGSLQASTGDSLKARTASVELERKAGATGDSDVSGKK